MKPRIKFRESVTARMMKRMGLVVRELVTLKSLSAVQSILVVWISLGLMHLAL
jgi:hypothetical protein